MNPITRRKLSIAFQVFNQARAKARRANDPKQLDTAKKILGRLVRDAYRSYHPKEYKPLVSVLA